MDLAPQFFASYYFFKHVMAFLGYLAVCFPEGRFKPSPDPELLGARFPAVYHDLGLTTRLTWPGGKAVQVGGRHAGPAAFLKGARVSAPAACNCLDCDRPSHNRSIRFHKEPEVRKWEPIQGTWRWNAIGVGVSIGIPTDKNYRRFRGVPSPLALKNQVQSSYVQHRSHGKPATRLTTFFGIFGTPATSKGFTLRTSRTSSQNSPFSE